MLMPTSTFQASHEVIDAPTSVEMGQIDHRVADAALDRIETAE
jgi:hypothetical protein